MIYDLKIVYIDETKGRIFNTKEIKWITKLERKKTKAQEAKELAHLLS